MALVGIAIGGVYFYVTSDDFRGRIESHASALAGRKTTIADISVDWGLTSHVHLSGVQFANAEWAKEPHMLKAELVDFEIRLWPLLTGDLVLPSLVLRKPEIVIEKGDNDRLNWELGEAPAAAAAAKQVVEPDNRFEAPLIGRLEVTDGKLSYRDPKRKLELDGKFLEPPGMRADHIESEMCRCSRLQEKQHGLEDIVDVDHLQRASLLGHRQDRQSRQAAQQGRTAERIAADHHRRSQDHPSRPLSISARSPARLLREKSVEPRSRTPRADRWTTRRTWASAQVR